MQTAAVKQKGIQSILPERGLWSDKMLLQCLPCKDKVDHDNRK
jgi:hypothetical protein